MRYYFRRSGNMVDDCLKSRLGNKMVCKTLVRKCPPVTKKCPLAKPRCSNPVCVDGKWVCKPTTITTTTTPAAGDDDDEKAKGNNEKEEGNDDEEPEGNNNNDENADGNNDEEPEPCGKVSAPTPGGPLADVYLKAHNKYRCMHGVPCMTWNEEIAKNAQKWADASGGQMKHSDKASRSDVGGFAYLGENLAFGDGVAGAKAVEMWYSEIKDTDGGKVTGFDHKTGHYTQNVWKASIALGCGEKGKLVVCQYGPGGNSGNYAENVLPPTKSEDACQAEGDNDEAPEGNNDEGAEGNNNDEGEGNDNEEAQGNNDEKAKGNNDYYYSKGGDKDEGEGGNDEGEEGNNDEESEGSNNDEGEGNDNEEPSKDEDNDYYYSKGGNSDEGKGKENEGEARQGQ